MTYEDELCPGEFCRLAWTLRSRPIDQIWEMIDPKNRPDLGEVQIVANGIFDWLLPPYVKSDDEQRRFMTDLCEWAQSKQSKNEP